MNPDLFAGVVTAAIVCGGLALVAFVWWLLSAYESRRIQRRLSPGDVPVSEFASDTASPVLQGIADRGKAIEGALDSEGESARLLIRAGWRSAGQRLAYYVSQALLPIALLALVAAVWFLGPEKLHKPVMGMLMTAIALMLGLLLPRMVLRRAAEARQRRIRGEVPLFIHVLVLLFESGLSLRQALASLVREGRGVLPEIGAEVEILLRQLEAGAETAEVLTRHAEALDVPDFTTVLLLMRQVERYGGEVKEPLLDTLSVIEQRRGMDLRELVNLISGRMTVVMVLCFFPALLVFVGGPAWVSVMQGLGSVAGGK